MGVLGAWAAYNLIVAPPTTVYYGPDFYYYLSDPSVGWFYSDDYSQYYDYYYRPSRERFASSGEFRHPFRYAGAFLSTQEFINLTTVIGNMDLDHQAAFRRAITSMADQFRMELSQLWKTSNPLTPGSLVVTDFEVLGSDQAVLIEGFADNGSEQLPLRAVLNLQDSVRSQFFIASSPTPTPDDQAQLNRLDEFARGFSDGR